MSFIQRLRAEYPDYVKSCEEDALSLTGIEFHGLDSQGRPSLDFSFGEGSDWTFGTLRLEESLCFSRLTFTDL